MTDLLMIGSIINLVMLARLTARLVYTIEEATS